MTVTVNIWMPKVFAGNIGHGSLTVGDAYLSRWPGGPFIFSTEGANNLYLTDVSNEGSAPSQINISGLDEGAVYEMAQKITNKMNYYSLLGFNCCTVVKLALQAGEGVGMKLWDTFGASFLSTAASCIPCTPPGLYAYASYLQWSYG